MVLYSTIKEENSPGNFAMLTRTASLLLSISWGGQVVFTDQTLQNARYTFRVKYQGSWVSFPARTPRNQLTFMSCSIPIFPRLNTLPLLSINQHLFNFPILDPPLSVARPELEELHTLIASPDIRLISLIGPGGVGKTHLAVQFASQVAESFPDGIYFISLTSIQDPDFMPILLADILNFSFYGPTNHIDQLGKYLHRLKVLARH